MEIDELFKQRSLIASKLKNCIRDKGYTKISFANKVAIEKSVLEEILDGSIADRKQFESTIRKSLDLLRMSVEDLVLYRSSSERKQTYDRYDEMSDTVKKQYNLLMDVVDLCAVYY